MSEWFYESMGQVVGPLTSAQLLSKVRAGEIVESTRIRKDDSQWVTAIEVNGLIQAAHRSLVQYKCPYCGATIERPPTVCMECDREVTGAYRHREVAAVPASPASAPAASSRTATTASSTAATPASASTQDQSKDGTVVHAVINWLKSLVR